MKIARRLAVFTGLLLAAIPALLWIYQTAQFGGMGWDISRMSADRVVATLAKAFLFATVATLIVTGDWLRIWKRIR
ncbi:hypothetical protein [Aureimonas populi]|uniref:Uncharacterized protein n=1 Tax=Aureimonas populi TaxID=1701758 RepID=A0ABW5CJK1_9HYPH|nr:hypothetical protein [Aureimonas populi]